MLLFNVIWFGATIASVATFLIRPGAARGARPRRPLGTTSRPHDYRLVFSVAGSYLVIGGVTGLVN